MMRSPVARTTVDLLAWFAFLIAAVALAVRFLPVVNHGILFLAALSPYLTIGAGTVAALLLVSNGRRWAAAVALVVVAAAVTVQLPRFIPARGGDGVAVRVVTVNLKESQADLDSVVSVARSHADVLVVEELKPELARQLSVLSSDFPYRVLDTNDSPGGIGIWSRHRLVSSVRTNGFRLGMLSATVAVPGVAVNPVVLGAHLVAPWPWPIDLWRTEMVRLRGTLDDMSRAAGSGAVIVAGDFNATTDMLPFRLLLRNGFLDAAEQAGAGFTPTFPADRAVPPLLGIDHILIRNGAASDVKTLRIAGTDHLGLTATIHLPG